jgi:hypothetical protein
MITLIAIKYESDKISTGWKQSHYSRSLFDVELLVKVNNKHAN